MQSVSFNAGQVILSEGQYGDRAYLIRNGVAKVTVSTRSGPKQVAKLDTGAVFGEMCLVEPGPRSASVTAITNVECLEMTYDEFLTSISEDPKQAIVFMQTLVQRLRQSNEMLAKLDPNKRGIGGMLADLRNKVALDSMDFSDEAAIRPYFTW